MARVKARIDVPYPVSAAEAIWYDVSRWASFVDGFGAVTTTEGDWPAAGSRVVWTSSPGGRGRVIERSEAYEVRSGQTVSLEDEKLRGRQSIAFTPHEGGARVELALEYELKQGGPLMALADVFFIRRSLRDSLYRTLRRFALEVRDDQEPF